MEPDGMIEHAMSHQKRLTRAEELERRIACVNAALDGIARDMAAMGALARAITAMLETSNCAVAKINHNDARPADRIVDDRENSPVHLIDDSGPARLTLNTKSPELTVNVAANQLQADSLQPRGRVAELIADGFFQTPRIGKEAYDYWKDRGFTSSSSRIYEALDSLTRDGFLVRVEKTKFQQHPALTVNKNGRKTTTITINYQ